MVVATARHPLAISKMHGAGNDFVVLDLREAQDPHPAMCSAIADRHKGVGCDLILGVAPPRSRSAVASYRIWTPDGSPSRQCGNGARCVAAWVVREGLAQGPEFALDSPSGTHAINVLPNGLFRIAMGVPRFAPEHIPLAHFAREQDVYEVDIEAGGRLRFAAVSIGNPHAVVDVTDIESARVSQLGPALQNSGYFPESVNVGFAQVIARDRIALRVYEFGSGETLACGTGACAAAAVMMRRGRVERDVAVALPGGDLHIAWPSPDAPMTLTGPAAFVFEGRLSFDVPR